MQSDATTVAEYLAGLPDDRREVIEAVREVILANLPDGFEEAVAFGMISYQIPLGRYPDTYNGQPLGIVALANQKRHMALYLMGVYGDDAVRERFVQEWKATGQKLDMGKSCVRFSRLDQVPLDVVAAAVARVGVDDYIAVYEASRA